MVAGKNDCSGGGSGSRRGSRRRSLNLTSEKKKLASAKDGRRFITSYGKA